MSIWNLSITLHNEITLTLHVCHLVSSVPLDKELSSLTKVNMVLSTYQHTSLLLSVVHYMWLGLWKSTMHVCDVCERKFHWVLFSLTSVALNVLPISVNFRRNPIKFCSSDRDYILLVYIVCKLWLSKDEKSAFFVLTWLIIAGPVTYCYLIHHQTFPLHNNSSGNNM